MRKVSRPPATLGQWLHTGVMSTCGWLQPGAADLRPEFRAGGQPQRQTKDRAQCGPHDAKKSQNKKNEPGFRDVASEPVSGAFHIEQTDLMFAGPIRTE